ncbi:helix-turn-helix domain-containing protein [Sedimentitalea sp. XS_ASV28]|uniref:MerR family transcriptional regulator n=1 Tax=Sedimentitalea sp. XS_ASV28 TaxID=3241296 RepID=UPI003517ACEE
MKNDHRKVSVLRRSDLARLTGCNLETIRYYENIGIMPDPPRTAKNYRAYDDTHVARLRFVMRSRDLGFTLEEIRDLLGLVDGRAGTCADVQAMATRHIESVRAKIVDLKRIETVLTETVSQCTGDDVPECAVIDALAEVA